ncbi:sensitivity to high expression protein she9, partial [Oleoguttula sp. CCFEE 5521]
FLLLEPYRRRRIVREVKEALDEKSISHVVPVIAVQEDATSVEAPRTTPAAVASGQVPIPDHAALDAPGRSGELAQIEGTLMPDVAPTPAAAKVASPMLPTQPTAEPGSFEQSIEQYRESFLDLFSERLIELRKVDVTTAALQGAASGIAVMGFLFLLLRPK